MKVKKICCCQMSLKIYCSEARGIAKRAMKANRNGNPMLLRAVGRDWEEHFKEQESLRTISVEDSAEAA